MDGSSWVYSRSFDQFANVALEGACERIIVGDLYCDIPLGLYVIRGSTAEIKSAQKAEKDATVLKGCMRKRMELLDFD